jgi:AAA+ ATPase superfamily predicted ATPase
MEFLDREDDLTLLRDHLTRSGAGLFVLYGRRRIGKTALIERAIQGGPPAAYHVGTRSTIAEEMSRLSASLSQAWAAPLLAAQPLSSSAALAAYLEGVREPAVLVLDEFPYLVESDPSLPGLLQAAWDRRLARSELKLVLCGSSIGMMEETTLSERSPLFGRRTGQLKLGPILPHYLGRAFPWRSPELIELAAVFGGVPGYLRRLDPDVPLDENLARHVLKRGEPLYEELPFLLREELREPRVYHAVLAVIASGARKFGEISSKVGLDRANLNRYLATLIDLGLVEREVPVTEPMPDKSRKGLYRISDPFVAAWFAFVHPNRNALEGGMEARVLAGLGARLADYLPRAVEPVVRDLFRRGPLSRLVPFEVAASGRHWSKESEFDIVLLDGTRRKAFVAEVKWSAKPEPAGLLEDLRRRVALEPAFSGIECTLAVVSRSGFKGSRRPARDGHLVDVSRVRL